MYVFDLTDSRLSALIVVTWNVYDVTSFVPEAVYVLGEDAALVPIRVLSL